MYEYKLTKGETWAMWITLWIFMALTFYMGKVYGMEKVRQDMIAKGYAFYDTKNNMIYTYRGE